MKTPVAIFFFNRPELLERTFAEVREVRPKTLFLICDGPRDNSPQDQALVTKCQELVAEIEWQCEVLINFSMENLGCRSRLVTGLDWVFEQVDSAIILEDDCLPGHGFFSYMELMLERYRDVDSVMHIAGSNLGIPSKYFRGDYDYSRYPLVWGWGSWRRAWKKYRRTEDVENFDPEVFIHSLRKDYKPRETEFWARNFNAVYNEKLDTWDYQWVYSIWQAYGLAVIPAQNQVSNIGFGPGATHTSDPSAKQANLATSSENCDWVAPQRVERNIAIDRYHFERLVSPPKWRRELARFSSKLGSLSK